MTNRKQQEAAKLFGNKSPKNRQSKSAPQIEKIRINNLIELKNLVKRLTPASTDDVAKPIVINTRDVGMADETYDGAVVIPQSGGESTLRQTILDGFEMIKNHQNYHKASLATQSSLEDYGGFPPAVVPDPSKHLTWLDTFIDRNMGGKREGLYIVWSVPEGKFRLDPWTCKLEKINAD